MTQNKGEPLKYIEFGIYYLKLRIAVWTGARKVEKPLDIKWRWEFWKTRIRRF
ncbi:MAG: hypothetical protein R2681_13045 [Pyrinomonadaceae bacterium]